MKKVGEKLLKKYLIRFGLIGTLTFLVFFVYFYKTSGKFRQSIISAFVALTVLFSSQQAAHSAGQADAFSQQNQEHQSRPHNKGFFSRKSNNDGPGPGKPNGNGSDGDDGGIPKYPKTESIEETQRYLSNIDEYIARMEESSDSEEEQCEAIEQKKEIRYRIKEDPGLVRAAKEACKNSDVQKDVNHLEEELAKGNENPGIGRKPICKGVTQHRGKNGGRLYVRDSDDNEIEILAKSGKKKSNQQFVINRLKEIYG